MLRTGMMMLAILTAAPASAMCIQGVAFDIPSTLQTSNDYLICLHNEQVKRLNEHAKAINDLQKRNDALEQAVWTLQGDNQMLRGQLDSLQSLVESMDALIETMN